MFLILTILWRIDLLLSGDSVNRPFLGNGCVNTLPLLGSRLLIMQQSDYNTGNGVFLRDSCRDVISKGQSQLTVLYGRLCREDQGS
jgi:hypothetical protein